MRNIEIALRLKAYELTDDDLMQIEALGFRASQIGESKVVHAVGVVICALQGNWKKPKELIKKDELTLPSLKGNG